MRSGEHTDGRCHVDEVAAKARIPELANVKHVFVKASAHI